MVTGRGRFNTRVLRIGVGAKFEHSSAAGKGAAAALSTQVLRNRLTKAELSTKVLLSDGRGQI